MMKLVRSFFTMACLWLGPLQQAKSQCVPSDVKPINNREFCDGATTSPINFTGTVAGTTYKWTNSNPTIGLTASDTGDIPSFTATNVTDAPITATVTVTPYNGIKGTYAYIPNVTTGEIKVIDVATKTVVTTIAANPNGIQPQG